jgi:hypothetical protein
MMSSVNVLICCFDVGFRTSSVDRESGIGGVGCFRFILVQFLGFRSRHVVLSLRFSGLLLKMLVYKLLYLTQALASTLNEVAVKQLHQFAGLK